MPEHLTLFRQYPDIHTSDEHDHRLVFMRPSDTDVVELTSVPERHLAGAVDAVPSHPCPSRQVDLRSCRLLATGAKFPDALGGSALAGVLDAPVLLTKPDMLLPQVAGEIDRLGAEEVYILGSERALYEDVYSALVKTLGASNVHRIGGADRYETADLVAQKVVELQGGAYDGTAFVATGENYADALAASPLAAANGWPVYLAPQPVISDRTVSAMKEAGVTDVILLGGEAAMPEGTGVSILEAGMTAVRIDGVDRYETAAKVAAYGVSDAGMSWDRVALATGETYPDALAGGAAQGRLGSVMLLSRSSSLPGATANVLADNASSIHSVRFFGGLTALSQAVRDSVMDALAP